MKNNEFIDLCVSKLVEYVNSNLDKSDDLINITKDCVFVVWSCKTLQNNKALLSTTLSDGMYYEFTYNVIKKNYILMLTKNGKISAIRLIK